VGEAVYLRVIFESGQWLSSSAVRGKCPLHLGTDNTSAATHELEQVPGRPRAYNPDYLELCTHYDLTPMTIHVGCPHEQGDVESQNRHLKRRLAQHLILRGSRDFQSVEAYDRFVEKVLRAANAKRPEPSGGGVSGDAPAADERLG
jgi:transposase InsO family protein